MKPVIRYPMLTTIEAFYDYARSIDDGHMGPHLPRLRALAAGLPFVVEFGVRRGGSSSALLLGADRLLSYDIQATAEARMLQKIAGERWDYRIQSSTTADVIPECDLLFIDSKHDFLTCDAELKRHAQQARRWLVFHDSVWRGTLGEGTTDRRLMVHPNPTIRAKALGIRPAIDDLMLRDPTWHLAASYPDSCGLLVLERRA